ncbi:MAG: sensor histidine kinase [Anaerolineae bacterium]
MESRHLEPGLLPIFRAYVFVRALGLVLVAMVKLPQLESIFFDDVLVTAGLYLIETLFLLGYLFWRRGPRKLGRWYLPLALFVAAVGPILQMRYFFSVYEVGEVLDFWLIFPFLTVPLIITAWQYSLREVLLYSVGTTLLEPVVVAYIAVTRPTGVRFDSQMLLARMIFLSAMGYIVCYLMTRQREQRRELIEANRKLISYAASQEQIARLHERNRLARELHDTLAHTLSGLTVQLDALAALWEPASPKAQRLLTHALSNARTGLDETRRALQNLRAAPLEDLGLALAVRNMAENVAGRGDLRLNLDISDDLGTLPTDVEQVFYRVTQEALENVLKHADAREVKISLHRNDGALALSVVDDGRGFFLEQAQALDRFGLRGLQERAALVGGSLAITTEPGEGTEVRLSAPIGV